MNMQVMFKTPVKIAGDKISFSADSPSRLNVVASM